MPNQFGTQRYALLFEPGTYGSTADPLVFPVGYYESVAGSARTRARSSIIGAIDTFNQCTTATRPSASRSRTSGARSPT